MVSNACACAVVHTVFAVSHFTVLLCLWTFFELSALWRIYVQILAQGRGVARERDQLTEGVGNGSMFEFKPVSMYILYSGYWMDA